MSYIEVSDRPIKKMANYPFESGRIFINVIFLGTFEFSLEKAIFVLFSIIKSVNIF